MRIYGRFCSTQCQLGPLRIWHFTYSSVAQAGCQLGPQLSLWLGQLYLAFPCGCLAHSQYGGLVPRANIPQGFACKLLLLIESHHRPAWISMRKTIYTHLPMEDCQNPVIKRAYEIGLGIFRKYTGPRNSGHSLLVQATH